MSGDVHVLFRERLEGKFLGATRLILEWVLGPNLIDAHPQPLLGGASYFSKIRSCAAHPRAPEVEGEHGRCEPSNKI